MYRNRSQSLRRSVKELIGFFRIVERDAAAYFGPLTQVFVFQMLRDFGDDVKEFSRYFD